MHGSRARAMKFEVYSICYADKYEEVRFFPADEVKAEGGIEALESSLINDAAWFASLGELEVRPDRHGRIEVPIAAIRRLLAAWEEKGSLKIQGQGRGPSPYSRPR